MVSNLKENPMLGVVVIGRNEGDRLMSCLKSIQSYGYPVVYVDSGSADDSLSVANKLATKTLSLDPSTAFSAARARNEGFEWLSQQYPSVEFVQFVDGDCFICDGWFDAAISTLEMDAKCAAVVGHLLERNPQASIYNRLCALEWKSPVGNMLNFGALGGISVIRASVFKQLDGFRANVIAGEDSELGVRISLSGYQVIKLDHNMATHDANMTQFGQWWKRTVRAGHAIGQRAFLNGQSVAKDCVRERKSTLVWGVALPLLVILLLIPTKGLSLLLLLAYLFLGLKIFLFRRRQQEANTDALVYAFFTVIGKVANGVGLLTFYRNHFKKQYQIIEYK